MISLRAFFSRKGAGVCGGGEEEVANSGEELTAGAEVVNSGDPLVEVGGGDGAVLCGGAAALGEVADGEIVREDEDAGGECDAGKSGGAEGGEELAGEVAVDDAGLGLVAHDAADERAVGKVDGGGAEIGLDEGGAATGNEDAVDFEDRFLEVCDVDEETL